MTRHEKFPDMPADIPEPPEISKADLQRFKLLDMQADAAADLEHNGTLDKARDIIAHSGDYDECFVHFVYNGLIIDDKEFTRDDGLTRVSIGEMPIVDSKGRKDKGELALKFSRPYVDMEDESRYIIASAWVPLKNPASRDFMLNGDFDQADISLVHANFAEVKQEVKDGTLSRISPDYTTIGATTDPAYSLPFARWEN